MLVMGFALMVVGVTGAYFSDTERSTGNTFAAGVIDLTVDNESYYNRNKCADVSKVQGEEDWQWVGTAGYPVPGTPCTTSWNLDQLANGHLFFDFTDLKPDDEGEDTISLHVDTNNAWACMNVALTSNDDVSSNEPELGAGDAQNVPSLWDGELAGALEFVWWADDGDNVLEDDENLLHEGTQSLAGLTDSGSTTWSVPLADSDENVWTPNVLEPLAPEQTYHIGKAWCFGDLTTTPLQQDNSGSLRSPATDSGVVCDGISLGNVYQTDQVTLDVSFFATQARHDSAYQCPEPEQPPVACEIVQSYADEVVAFDQGLRKDSTAVIPARSDPDKALFAPQSTGTPYDDTSNASILNGFYSLGFPLGGNTTEIVLSFNDNNVVDAVGNDLKLWEVTGGTSYPDERVDVFVGNTPVGPWTQVGNDVTRDAEMDIASAGVGSAWRYVRIVDASDLALFEATADGYDLDAVQALNCIVSPAR